MKSTTFESENGMKAVTSIIRKEAQYATLWTADTWKSLQAVQTIDPDIQKWTLPVKKNGR